MTPPKSPFTESGVTFTGPYMRADGHIGAHAEVVIAHSSGWQGAYSFDTHGMTSDEAVAKIREFETYHDAKANRLSGFRAIHGSMLTVGHLDCTVVDCTIFDRDVTLYVDVRCSTGTVQGFPLRVAYHRVENVPSDAEIVQMIRDRIPIVVVRPKEANDEFAVKVREKLKVKP